MLTEKDYCDYETCVALKELGYKVPTSAYYIPNNNQLIFVSNPYRGGYVIDCFYSHNSFPKNVMTSNYIDAPTMWEAQKWLREEHGVIVEVFVDDDSDTPITYNVHKDGECVCHHHEGYWSVKEWETALSEGIKGAVKILKEDETIHE